PHHRAAAACIARKHASAARLDQCVRWLTGRAHAKEEGLPLRAALPLSSRDPAHPVARRVHDASDRVDPHYGKDPADGCRQSRRMTMRHWITAFPLLTIPAI